MHAVSFGDVQRTILQHHEELRARIEGLRRTAERCDLPWALRAMRALLLRFAAQFDAHLGYEERELAPRIRDLDAWGKAREAALLAEHREQRKQLERICVLVETATSSDIGDLFNAVLELTDRLLEDMSHEERALEQFAWIDENGCMDQMTG